MTEDILSGLNENQLAAVTATEGYVRVAAGAGSGKTRVLTDRYVYIAEMLGISPEHILSVPSPIKPRAKCATAYANISLTKKGVGFSPSTARATKF